MLSSTFVPVSTPRLTRYAVVLVVAIAGFLAATTPAAAQSPPTCGGLAVDIGAGQTPTAGPDVFLGTPGPDRIFARGGDDVICGLGGNDRIFVGGGTDTCTADAGLDTVRGCNGQTRGGRGRYSVALMVANAGSLTPLEQSLTTMLQGRGHTVTPFTVTARPIVNARNNPTIDLLLFSPSFEFSMLYHPAQRNALPMLDMTKWSWYRRYVLPWSDDIAGPRFSGVTDSSRRVRYENARVIPWERRVGPVRVMRATRFSGGAPMRRAMNHSTRGDAQYFLRHVSDTGAESTIGVYVPAGSTVTKPAPTRAEERRRTSRAPWVGLILFNDDSGTRYTELTPAGRRLFEAAMARLMNP